MNIKKHGNKTSPLFKITKIIYNNITFSLHFFYFHLVHNHLESQN
jgi:hypothetical protein